MSVAVKLTEPVSLTAPMLGVISTESAPETSHLRTTELPESKSLRFAVKELMVGRGAGGSKARAPLLKIAARSVSERTPNSSLV